MESDGILLERYASTRDAEAFAELVRRYAAMVHGVSLRITRNNHDAEDVSQECFLTLAGKAGAIRSSLPGWLHSLAVSRSRNLARRQSARRRREAAAALNEDAGTEVASWEAVAPYVDHAIEHLPDDLRAMLIEHYLRGRTQEEIAAESSCDRSTVSRHLAHAVELVRTELANEGIMAPAVVLTVGLGGVSSHVAPAALVATLGKMAVSGVGAAGKAVTTWAVAAWKVAAIATAAAAVVTVGTLVATRASDVKVAPPPVSVQAVAQPTIGLPPGKPSADVLPEGTWIMLEIPDLGATRARAKDNSIYKILTDPQVKEYLKPVSDKLDELFKKTDLELQARIKLSFDDLRKLANGRLTIASTEMNANIARTGAAFTVVLLLTPADPQDLNNCVTKLLSGVPPDATKKIQTRVAQGTTISEIPYVSWAIAGNTLVVCLSEKPGKSVDHVLARMVEGGPCLSTNPTYMAVREKMKDVNQDWMIYVSLEQLVQLFLALNGEKAAWADAHLNLQQFKALAIAGKLDGAGVDDAIYLHLPGEPGKAAALLMPKPVDMKLLECVPEDASGFCVTRLNLPLAYDTVVGAIKELAPPQTYDNFVKGLDNAKLELGVAIEDEIVRPLGEELVVYHVPVPIEELKARLKGLNVGERAPLAHEYGMGRTVLMFTLKDSAKIRQGLEALTDSAIARIKQLSLGYPEHFILVKETYQGVELRTLKRIRPFPSGYYSQNDRLVQIFTTEGNIQPAYAVTDKFLIISGSPELVRQAIDMCASHGKNITESAAWPEVKAQIPEGVGAIMATNPAAGVEQARLLTQEVTVHSIRPILRTLGGRGPATDLGFGELPQKDPAPFIDARNRSAFVSVFTVTTESDGVMLRGHSVAGTVPGIAVSGLINILLWQEAWIDCKYNLVNLRWAIWTYNGSHNDRMPQTLEELLNGPPHKGMYLCPATGHLPAPPGEEFQTDYEYIGGILPPEFAASNVVILRDKIGNHPDGMWYMEYDSNIKWAPRDKIAAVFQESLKELEPWLELETPEVQKKVREFYQVPK